MALKKYHGWIVQKIFQVSRPPSYPRVAAALGDLVGPSRAPGGAPACSG